MYTILVAGAGHGGLAAAALLAKAGCDVTVLEKRQESELGHDWEDRFTFSLLSDLSGMAEADLPGDIWRTRGDCAFVSPNKEKRIPIHYTEETRQKVMWRKPLISLLIQNAKDCGVNFRFETEVKAPLLKGNCICGLQLAEEELHADLVIDAAGAFSPVRSNLPAYLGIENKPRRGDLFYACRTYFDKLPGCPDLDEEFDVYLCHENEPGLSWVCTNEDTVDVLIGRIDPLSDEELQNHLARFREEYPWMGKEIKHGGQRGFIPVRRSLTLMIANGYAAVGDSAFMTTPMNGMGIDLSLQAGKLLAETVLNAGGKLTAKALWPYNRDFHRLYGGETARNEALKNTILTLPEGALDALFAADIVEASDLAGAGSTMSVASLGKKLARGLSEPEAFLKVVGGIVRGRIVEALYKKVPEEFNRPAIMEWDKRICAMDIKL